MLCILSAYLFQVKLIDGLETAEKDLFTAAQRNWCLTQTDGNTVYIKVDGEGNPVPLKYEDREKYCEEVRRIRLEEFDEQVSIIQPVLSKHVRDNQNVLA